MLGYRHAVALKVIQPLDADTEEWAMRSPVRRLPGARLIETKGTVSLLVNQTVGATEESLLTRAEAYAPVIGCPSEFVRVERVSNSVVRIIWPRTAPTDRLAESLPFDRNRGVIDPMQPLVIGRTESGEEFRLPIFGRQTLLVGASGSGKGSVIWSTVLALAPSIREGMVRVHGVDLKGGVELVSGAALMHETAYTYEDAVKMLSGLRELLDDRLAYMRENGLRKHIATQAEPLELLLIDEAASLTYLAPDAKSKAAVDADLKRILSTARAAGVAVLAAMQDPRKESLGSRDLFTQTVALRFRTKDDAQLALGATAYEAGAHCDLIPQSQPGTGYMIDGESGQVTRFRAFWVADEVISEFAQEYGMKASAEEVES